MRSDVDGGTANAAASIQHEGARVDPGSLRHVEVGAEDRVGLISLRHEPGLKRGPQVFEVGCMGLPPVGLECT